MYGFCGTLTLSCVKIGLHLCTNGRIRWILPVLEFQAEPSSVQVWIYNSNKQFANSKNVSNLTSTRDWQYFWWVLTKQTFQIHCIANNRNVWVTRSCAYCEQTTCMLYFLNQCSVFYKYKHLWFTLCRSKCDRMVESQFTILRLWLGT